MREWNGDDSRTVENNISDLPMVDKQRDFYTPGIFSGGPFSRSWCTGVLGVGAVHKEESRSQSSCYFLRDRVCRTSGRLSFCSSWFLQVLALTRLGFNIVKQEWHLRLKFLEQGNSHLPHLRMCFFCRSE